MRSKRITNLRIFCFSGTGNSKNVAQWIKKNAEEQNCRVNLAELPLKNDEISPFHPDETIILTSPVHGFNYPPLVIGFLLRFPKGKNNVILMNTRAGMKIGRWITPGLSGITFYFAAFVLMLKGYSIKGMVPVDMPSNWIFVHPGLNSNTINYLHEQNHKRVIATTNRLLSGKTCFIALREIVQDLLIAPIAVAYYFIGRFIIAKTYYTSSKCNDCGLCITMCPAKAIKRINQRPFWTMKCESCMRCMSNCPQKSIETAHGFIAIIIFAYSAVITKLLYPILKTTLLFTSPIINMIFESLIFLILIALGYRIFHLLLKFKSFERLMLLTSLTWYRFWGKRYKAIKNYGQK